VNIRVELLGQPQRIRDALCRDGWSLSGPGTNLIASNPAVLDEGTARTHLYALGLLTSGSVRIEFLLPPVAGAPPARHAATGRIFS
jgi:hypothetical protein